MITRFVDGDDVAEIESTSKDGHQMQAVVFSNPGVEGSTKWLAAIGRLGYAEMAKATTGSKQVSESDPMAGDYDLYAVIEPPVVPAYYAELYRRDPTHHACVDGRVAAVAQQGWRIRPRRELWPSVDVGGEDPDEVDEDKRVEIIKVFDAGLPNYSFTDMLGAMYQDQCVTGNGWIEIIRDNDKDDTISRMEHAKSVTMRIARDLPGFVQIRGRNKVWFARYGTDGKALLLERKKQEAIKHEGMAMISQNSVFVPKAVKFETTINGLDLAPADLMSQLAVAKTDGEEIAVSVNEMLHFKTASPKDTEYGEPGILSAIEDYLIAQNVRMFLLSYFDNATIPRCAFFVKGEGRLNESVLKTLDSWFQTQNKLDVLNQTLVVDIPADTEIQIERLSSEHLGTDGSLIRPREVSDRQIYKADRTPPSIVFDLEGLNRAVSGEADLKFVQFVVRPEQRMLEQRFNALIEREFDTRDLVLDLLVPDLTMMAERRQLWQMLSIRGIMSINEIRKELQLPPIDGGDVPILLIPGQGYIPISAFDDPDAVKAMLERGREDMESGNIKTPPQGGGGEGTAAGKAIVIPSEATQALSPEAQAEMSHILEQLSVANVDDLQHAFPEAYPDSSRVVEDE